MLNLNHKNLDAWKTSLDLVEEVYKVTDMFPSEERYGLISQMRRAAVSVTSNISEGAARVSVKERKRFYEIARSSLVELDTQIVIALRLQFLSTEKNQYLSKTLNSTFALLTALKSSTTNK